VSRGAHTFRQSDVVRAIKAVRAAGEQVARIEIDRDGKIVLSIGAPGHAQAQNFDPELEKWLNEN
jgi:hypothetical protein